MLPRAMSRHLFDISKDGEFTASCWHLYRGSITLPVKQCFLMLQSHCHDTDCCHQLLALLLVTLRTHHGGKNVDGGHVTEELMRETAQAVDKKGCTSQGWQVSVSVKRGREKWPVRQAAPLFFLVLYITARRLDWVMSSSKYPLVFYLLQNSSWWRTML